MVQYTVLYNHLKIHEIIKLCYRKSQLESSTRSCRSYQALSGPGGRRQKGPRRKT